MKTQNDSSHEISVREAAAILDLSTVYVHRLIEQGRLLKASETGNKVFLRRSDVEALKATRGKEKGLKKGSKLHLKSQDDIINIKVPKEQRRLLDLYLGAKFNGLRIEDWLAQKIDAAVKKVETALNNANEDL